MPRSLRWTAITWILSNSTGSRTLSGSNAAWKICYFHHPLYSDGQFHGPDVDLRPPWNRSLSRMESRWSYRGTNTSMKECGRKWHLLLRAGESGELRPHDLKRSAETAKGFDTDRTFELVEIAGDQLFFQTISRSGASVDSGVVDAGKKPATNPDPAQSGAPCQTATVKIIGVSMHLSRQTFFPSQPSFALCLSRFTMHRRKRNAVQVR